MLSEVGLGSCVGRTTCDVLLSMACHLICKSSKRPPLATYRHMAACCVSMSMTRATHTCAWSRAYSRRTTPNLLSRRVSELAQKLVGPEASLTRMWLSRQRRSGRSRLRWTWSPILVAAPQLATSSQEPISRICGGEEWGPTRAELALSSYTSYVRARSTRPVLSLRSLNATYFSPLSRRSVASWDSLRMARA